jgi:hypothetical protein
LRYVGLGAAVAGVVGFSADALSLADHFGRQTAARDEETADMLRYFVGTGEATSAALLPARDHPFKPLPADQVAYEIEAGCMDAYAQRLWPKVPMRVVRGAGKSGRDVLNRASAPTTGRAPGYGCRKKGIEMKYMIMMFGGLGATLQTRTPEWIAEMHELLMKLDGELRENGELVASHGLVDPSQATTVRFVGGAPVPTDGPFAEIKESLAGYWVVDVSEERAIEIASRVVAYIEYPMEVRRIMKESADL